MCLALIGAVSALLFLSYFHNRALEKIRNAESKP
jgi:hypothetical protein